MELAAIKDAAPALLACALAFPLSCCAGRSKVAFEPGMDLGRFKRIGVLPFTDPRGQGRKIAAELGRGLLDRGFDSVDLRQLESVFKGLKLDYSTGLSLHALADIKSRTMAEALLFGSIDSRWQEASLILIETDMGEVVLRAKLKPRRGKSFERPEDAAREALGIFSSLAAREAP